MITLTEDMQVGVFEVDLQQTELIGRLNAIVLMNANYASKEDAQKTLNLVGEHIVRHLDAEEEIMQDSGYPELDWHREQHQLFIEEYKKLEEEFAANGISPRFTLELSNSIINWIVTHIKSADVEFGRFYLQQ